MTSAVAVTVIHAIPMTSSACAAPTKGLTTSQHRLLRKPTRWQDGLYATGQRVVLSWILGHQRFTGVFMTTTLAMTKVTIKLGQLIWTPTGRIGTSSYRFPATTIHSRTIHP